MSAIRMSRTRVHQFLLALASVTISGCSGGGGDSSSVGGGISTPTAPPTPSAITVSSGADQVADVGAQFALPFSVRVASSTGAAVSGANVSFAVVSGTGSVNPATSSTNAQGIATTSVTAGSTPGTLVIAATVAGLSAPVTASFTIRFNLAQLAGQWDGTTSQNLPVYIRITATGLIDSLTVRTRATLGTGTCTATMATKGIQIQSNGSFAAPLTIPLLWTTTLRGSFGSGTGASGSLDALAAASTIICGSTLFFTSGNTTYPGGTWTATKRP